MYEKLLWNVIVFFKKSKFETHTVFFESGNKEVYFECMGEKLHGSNIRWYENGNVCSILNFKRGKVHGKCIQYSEDGVIESRENFKMGKKIP